ncbi:MAG: DMT family transporter [Rubrivivax sp.]|jgi:drug/metabolite transporter (DMT)-like permease|nr:DMT family transporter [Rubrivivax sp.]
MNAAVPPRALLLLVVLTLVWGTNWPLFPLATREVSVWTFRAVALMIAGPTLLLVARLKGYPLAVDRRHWGTLAAATLCYLLIWNIASTYAAILIPSGQAAILGFTMPLWLALVSWAVLGQRMTGRTLLAIALGGGAVALLMWDGMDAYAKAPLGFMLGLLAGLGWAIGTLIIKRQPINSPAIVTTGWQLLGAAVPTALVALVLGQGHWFWPSWTSIAVIGYIALVPMCIGNAAWFAIVGLLPAQVAGLSSIAVPIVAMVSGAWVHGEPLGPLQWGAMACCVGGLWLALGAPQAPRAPAAAAPRSD